MSALGLTIALLLSGPAVPLSPQTLASHEGWAPLPQRWKLKKGDNLAWLAPDFDDSAWPETKLNICETQAKLEQPGERLVARLTFEVSEELVGAPLKILLVPFGATEIYLNGRSIFSTERLHSFYDARTSTLRFDKPGKQVLALRYRPAGSPEIRSRMTLPGFLLKLGTIDAVDGLRAHTRKDEALGQIFTGVALTLAFIHLMLFLFHRSDREHLHYAMMTSSAGAIAISNSVFGNSQSAWVSMLAQQGFKVAVVFASMASLRMSYQLFANKAPGMLYRAYVVFGSVLVVTSWALPVTTIYVYAMFGLTALLLKSFMALFKGVPGAWLLALGGLAAGLASALQMLPIFFGKEPRSSVYLHGFMIYFATISIYLARTFARTHRQLAEQLTKALEQERRANDEQLARQSLEAENQRKALLLEEAQKREAVLEELEAVNKYLRDTQAQLVHQGKMASLGNLVAGVAHEINTPIGAIYSVHQSLRVALDRVHSILQAESPELIENNRKLKKSLAVLEDAAQVINSGSTRVKEIVKRLRTFARLDEAELARVDLHEGLEDTLQLVRHELKKGIQVERNFGELPNVTCYPSQLNQVHLNLIVNAIHAMDAGGKLTISTSLEDDRAVIEYADTGHGISKENLERIFDPGFTTKGVKVGTGLGLSISSRIVQDHRGTLKVSSEPEKGTTFTLSIPLDLE